MTSPTSALQRAAAAALIGAPSVVALVADTTDGPAVFAPNNGADVFSRLTIWPPQWIPRPGCSRAGDLILEVDAWAHGPAATLEAGDLADAALVVLDAVLALDGWRISSRRAQGANPIGDPDPAIARSRATVRYSVQATA